MSIESRELALFIINDRRMFDRFSSPACVSLASKVQKHKFEVEKAKVLFGHIAEAGAKEYHKHFGSKDSAWFKMFDTTARRECATELLEYYTEGIEELAGMKIKEPTTSAKVAGSAAK